MGKNVRGRVCDVVDDPVTVTQFQEHMVGVGPPDIPDATMGPDAGFPGLAIPPHGDRQAGLPQLAEESSIGRRQIIHISTVHERLGPLLQDTLTGNPSQPHGSSLDWWPDATPRCRAFWPSWYVVDRWGK